MANHKERNYQTGKLALVYPDTEIDRTLARNALACEQIETIGELIHLSRQKWFTRPDFQNHLCVILSRHDSFRFNSPNKIWNELIRGKEEPRDTFGEGEHAKTFLKYQQFKLLDAMQRVLAHARCLKLDGDFMDHPVHEGVWRVELIPGYASRIRSNCERMQIAAEDYLKFVERTGLGG